MRLRVKRRHSVAQRALGGRVGEAIAGCGVYEKQAMTTNSELFAVIWQYSIHGNLEPEFLAAYRADGEWARLFRQDPNYIRTELLQDANSKNRYMTIDYWTSQSARDAFQTMHGKEYAELDRRCDAFTTSEELVGDFVSSR